MTGIVPGNRWHLLPEPVGRAADESGPRVDVVVCHYDQHAALARTVAALHRQTRRPTSIIVADDGSPSPPDAAALAGDVPVRVVTQPDRGFRAAAARNLGAGLAGDGVLVFLDADTTPEPGFLAALTRRHAVAPDVVAVGRRRHADLSGVGPGDDPAAAPRYDEPAWLADGYRRTRDLRDADGASFRFVISAVLAVHRSLFDDVGGFDPRFVGYGGEDWDLAYRAWNNGALLVHEPGAVAWHDGPDWAGREGATATKDGETMRLAALVPGPTTRTAALPGAVPDVLADPDPSLRGRDLVAVVDSVLNQTHRDVRVRLPGADPRVTELYRGVADPTPWSPDQRRRARAVLSVRSPLAPDALARAMDLLVGNDLGRVEWSEATLAATRALGRARRRGEPADRAQEREGVLTMLAAHVDRRRPPAGS